MCGCCSLQQQAQLLGPRACCTYPCSKAASTQDTWCTVHAYRGGTTQDTVGTTWQQKSTLLHLATKATACCCAATRPVMHGRTGWQQCIHMSVAVATTSAPGNCPPPANCTNTLNPHSLCLHRAGSNMLRMGRKGPCAHSCTACTTLVEEHGGGMTCKEGQIELHEGQSCGIAHEAAGKHSSIASPPANRPHVAAQPLGFSLNTHTLEAPHCQEMLSVQLEQ